MASARNPSQETESLISGQTPSYGSAPPPADTAPKPGWGRRIGGWVYRATVKPVAEGLYQAVRHPIATGASLLTALPSAINAFAAASHTQPENISVSWWQSLSPLKQAHSITNALSSLITNIIMNRDFLSTTFEGLKAGFKNCCKSFKEFAGNAGMVLVSCIGALTAGVIAYGAFLFLPFGSILAGIPALVNFMLYFATGYVSLQSFIKKFMESRNPDIQFQKECIDKLKHLKAEYFAKINTFLASQHTKDILLELQQKDLDIARQTELQAKLNQTLLDLVSGPLEELKALGTTIINDKTNGEIAKEWAGTIFDITLAVAAVFPTFMTFTEAGFRGFAMLEKFGGGTLLENSAQAAKIALGAVPGILSCAFYGLVDLGFRQTMINLATRLYHNPHEIPGALTLLAMNAFGASGMENIAEGMTLSPTNIFSLKPPTESTFSHVYVALNSIAAGTTNEVLTVNSSYMNQGDAGASDLANLISYLENTGAHPLPHSVVEQLQSVGLFSTKAATPDGYTQVPDMERGARIAAGQ